MNNGKVLDTLKRYDYSFFAIASIIFIMGSINLYSATHTSEYLSGLYKTQIIYFLISIVVGVGISFIQPKTFMRFSYLIYGLNIILLIIVLFLGEKGMGARRWLAIGGIRFQPSELMKISVILILARYYSKKVIGDEIGLKELIIPFIICFLPAALIIIEPDLGTGLMLFLIFFVVSFYCKLKWKSIFIIGIIGLISGLGMYKYGLKEYQRKRILTFLDPSADKKGSGYNAIQSKIAIGSGKVFGKGFKKSSQASLNYLPENHTDFVFSIFNEEHGFFGSLFLIGIYVMLLFRFIHLATSVTKLFNSIVVMGLMSIFFWHTFINMGMVTGLMPIVGLPLPYMSYGGSSLLTFSICCGLATSISNSKSIF